MPAHFRNTWREAFRELLAIFRSSFGGPQVDLLPFEPYPSHHRPPMKKANASGVEAKVHAAM